MTMHDLAAGYTYVVGTHFCFPPIYARFGTVAGRRKATWHWTHELLAAHGFVSREDAERFISGNADFAKLLEGLDDAARRRITVLKAELKVGPAGDSEKGR